MTLKFTLSTFLLCGLLTGCAEPKGQAFSAVQSICAKLVPSPSISVRIEADEPSVHNQRSRAAISNSLNLAGKKAGKARAFGATSALVEQESSFSSRHFSMLGASCVAPQVDVVLRMKNTRIDIARDFKKGSCRYADILEHELHHVEIQRNVMRGAKRVIEQEFNKRYPSSSPLVIRGSGLSIGKWRNKEQEGWLLPLISRELNKAEAANSFHDRPEEYLRLTNNCSREPIPPDMN